MKYNLTIMPNSVVHKNSEMVQYWLSLSLIPLQKTALQRADKMSLVVVK